MPVRVFVWLRTLAMMISPEDALRHRREREREHRTRETPAQREARLYQRRLRDRELFSKLLHAAYRFEIEPAK